MIQGLRPLLLCLTLAICVGCGQQAPPLPPGSPQASGPPAQIALGVNYADWQDAFGTLDSQEALVHLQGLGITSLTYIPTWYQEAFDSTEIKRIDGVTPRDAQLVLDMRRARTMGFTVGLNLHVDLYDGSSRNRIAFKNTEDFDAWWENYERVVLHYAAIAGANQLEHFSVGCELSGVAIPPYTDRWQSLIARVRTYMKPHGGLVTYTARHQNLANLGFLRELDVIGVNLWPYFNDSAAVSVDSRRTSWDRAFYLSEDFQTRRADTNSYAARGYEMDTFAYLRWIAKVYERPIWITEFGCQSRQGALRQPVEWQASGNPDVLGQALYYAGFFAALRADAANSRPPYPIERVVLWNYMIKDAGPTDTDYTFRNKPLSEAVIRGFLEEQTP